MMPGESGLSLTKEIKQNNPTPIILLTAKGEVKDRIEGLKLGADDYLGKPFEPKELLLRIKNILNKMRTPVLPEKIYIGNTLINLKNLGNTVIVVEHDAQTMQASDWIIDLGPEGGNKGGTVVAAGTPEDIVMVKESYTGLFLSQVLNSKKKVA